MFDSYTYYTAARLSYKEMLTLDVSFTISDVTMDGSVKTMRYTRFPEWEARYISVEL